VSGCRLSCVISTRTFHAWNNNIIVRVSIVSNEYAASVIASQFDSVRVDLADWSNNRLSIWSLDNSLSCRNGGSGEFGVDIRGGWGMAAGLLQLDAVG